MADLQSERVTPVHAFFGALDRLLRAVRLYGGVGARVDQLGDALLATAKGMLAGGPVTLQVAPFGFVLDGAVLGPEGSALEKAAFALFRDGMRELTFEPGLTAHELGRLVRALTVDAQVGEEDAITLLWDAGFQHVSYFAVDLLQEGGGGPGDTGGTGEAALSADDLRLLKLDDALPWLGEARSGAPRSEALADDAEQLRARLAQDPDPEPFVRLAAQESARTGEPSPLLLGYFDAVVRAGDAALVGRLLSLASVLEDSAPGAAVVREALLSPARAVALAPLLEQAGDDTLAAIEEAAATLRDKLVPTATRMAPGPARDRLLGYLQAGEVQLTDFHAEALRSDELGKVLDGASALAALAEPGAFGALCRALNHPRGNVRTACLAGLFGRYDPDARIVLGRVLRDPDRVNRLLALTVLVDSRDLRVGGLVLAAVEEPAFKGRDFDEQVAMLRALGTYRHPRVLAYLRSLVEQRNLTRSRALADLQREALRALGSHGTPDARAVVVAVAGRWGVSADLKDAAKAELQGWRDRPRTDESAESWFEPRPAAVAEALERSGAFALRLKRERSAEQVLEFALGPDTAGSFDASFEAAIGAGRAPWEASLVGLAAELMDDEERETFESMEFEIDTNSGSLDIAWPMEEA